MKVSVWYMKKGAFGDCCLAATFGTEAVSKADFPTTHEKVATLDVSVDDRLGPQDAAWMQTQEPDGMRSMACGDIVEVGDSHYVCVAVGWRELK